MQWYQQKRETSFQTARNSMQMLCAVVLRGTFFKKGGRWCLLDSLPPLSSATAAASLLSLLSFVKALAEMNFNEEERKEGCWWDAALSLFPFLNQPTNHSRAVTPLPFKKAPMGGTEGKGKALFLKKIKLFLLLWMGREELSLLSLDELLLLPFSLFGCRILFSQCGSFFMPKSVLFHSTFSQKKEPCCKFFAHATKKEMSITGGWREIKKSNSHHHPSRKKTREFCVRKN